MTLGSMGFHLGSKTSAWCCLPLEEIPYLHPLLPCPPGFMLLQEHRQVCKSGGAGMLLSAYMKIQCTAILLDRMNLKNRGPSAPQAPPLSTPLS